MMKIQKHFQNGKHFNKGGISMQHSLGALKVKTDLRDYKIVSSTEQFPEIYLCENLPPVKNQKSVNSCVAHATSTILETFNTAETGNFIPLSTNFIYGMQGIACGRTGMGMYLRDACKIVKEYGDPLEITISGNTEQPKCTEKLKPLLNDTVYNEAKNYKVNSYARCPTVKDLKHALMNYGPVLASIKWYNKYSFKDNILIFDKQTDYGYHAVMICGWNKQGWICQNSWGSS